MRVLFINHHFDQDIEELISARYKQNEFRYISANYFALRARKFLPKAVFDGELLEYHKPKYKLARHKWAKAAPKVLYELYQIYPFDVIISPSDTFFYIRDVISASRKLGVPFIVAQKETTISPGTMVLHSKEIGDLFPFISDYMTVCSKRHKEFWLKSGAPSEKIEVTGQPRFDFYYKSGERRSLEELGFPISSNKKIVLFFTYELNAYLPKDQTWKKLREETENVLASLARENLYNIIVKPHPQHNKQDIEYFSSRIKLLAGSNGSKYVFIAGREVDARKLIVNADIIIAFQSTVLLESLASRKRVIYTFWSKTAKEYKLFFLPFHHYKNIMKIAYSPQDLRRIILKNESKIYDKKINERMHLFTEYLGPLDGKASERTWKVVERVVTSYPPLSIEQVRLRNFLRRKCYIYCSREIFIAKAMKFFWQLLFSFSRLLQLKSNNVNRIVVHIERQGNRVMECKGAIGNSSSYCRELIGHIDEGIFRWFVNKIIKKSKI